MPNQHCESHHRICQFMLWNTGYGMKFDGVVTDYFHPDENNQEKRV